MLCHKVLVTISDIYCTLISNPRASFGLKTISWKLSHCPIVLIYVDHTFFVWYKDMSKMSRDRLRDPVL